jgi:hypothetical protein
MIVSLLYATTTRPDIMQVVGLVARFQSAPKETHMKEVKRIFKYLKGTLDFGLWYPREEEFTLTTYINTDWNGSVDDKNSTNGNSFFLGECLVPWSSRKQSSISLSTVEAKYISATKCCTQILWIKKHWRILKLNIIS